MVWLYHQTVSLLELRDLSPKSHTVGIPTCPADGLRECKLLSHPLLTGRTQRKLLTMSVVLQGTGQEVHPFHR